MDEQESILREFLVECAEGIERLDQEFVLLEAVDAIKEILAHIRSTLREMDQSYDAVRQKLDAFLTENADAASAPAATPPEAPPRGKGNGNGKGKSAAPHPPTAPPPPPRGSPQPTRPSASTWGFSIN